MPEPSTILREFVTNLLASEGAVVESVDSQALEFLAPPALQQSLRVPEFGRLGFGPQSPPDAERVTFESDWIRRLGDAIGDRGRTARVVIHGHPPPLSNPERILEHGLALQNAVYRFVGQIPCWTRYWVLSFRFAAIADERRDGIIKLAVNLATNSTPDDFVGEFESALGQVEEVAPFPPTAQLPSWDRNRVDGFLSQALPDRVRASLRPFLNGIDRRLERDANRLYAYYDGLRLQAEMRVRSQSSDLDREQGRVAAIQREYQAKVADLEQKHALKIEVEPIQTLEVVMMVRRFELLIKRRKSERRVFLDWNSLVRRLEKLPCEATFASDAGRVVCDEALHIVSLASHGRCSMCGKEYCRACHPVKCPACSARKKY